MSASLPFSRRDEIATRLLDGKSVVAAQLAAEFKVSEDAVRRDLRALADEGKCRRVYGGALPIFSVSQPIATRVEEATLEKAALAQIALQTILPGEFLFFDSGSTNLALASLLPPALENTIATNSVLIAAEILKRGDIPLVLIGGQVNHIVGGSVDAAAVAGIEELNIDRCFVGTCAVSATTGLSVHELADSIFKKTLLRRSAIRIAMATSHKMQQRAPHRIGGSADIDALIVSNDLPEDAARKLVTAGFKLVKGKGDETPHASES